MNQRQIVHIDESKCDGCGECVPSCEEGAIRIIDGKARLVSDVYCDGLGACLNHCPRDAISIIEREAEPFDEAAAIQHVARLKQSLPIFGQTGGCPGSAVQTLPTTCPSSNPRTEGDSTGPNGGDEGSRSRLGNWPVQLHLVPPHAPFLRHADLLLVADCVPFAYADFHRRFLKGRPVLIGCPKLDDGQAYVQKLTGILRTAAPTRLSVLHMDVPCCTGLLRIAQAAIEMARVSVPLQPVTITRDGREIDA
jgi:Pyruvate/2-oxoacid:ferredoxin oxidoreductase delta subunit